MGGGQGGDGYQAYPAVPYRVHCCPDWFGSERAAERPFWF